MGAKKGHPRYGGRVKGMPNKATTERALQWEARWKRARAEGHDLARDVLDKYMTFFVRYSMKFRPSLDGEDVNPTQDVAEFHKYASLAIDCAHKLAPYQSPTFRAIVVSPPPDPTGKVTEVTLKIFDSGDRPLIEHKRVIDEEAMS
jgi:hypothetical protein